MTAKDSLKFKNLQTDQQLYVRVKIKLFQVRRIWLCLNVTGGSHQRGRVWLYRRERGELIENKYIQEEEADGIQVEGRIN